MGVKIGHASIDENGHARGGQAGDQTGREVCIRDWYDKGWNKVIRSKSTEAAETIAKTMEAACKNDNIGYNQNQRNSLYQEAKGKNWDVAKITKKCETDCSALVRVCVCAAGIQVPDVYTGNLAAVLKGTGEILLKEGSHTAVVL